MLEGANLSIEFGGVRALQDVSIMVPPACVTSVVGPNGAGKTTLFNCLTGHVRPTAGSVRLATDDVTGLAPHHRARRGLSRAFQTPRVDLDQDVLSSAQLGCYGQDAPGFLAAMVGGPRVWKRERAVRDRAMTALDRVGMAHLASRRAGELSLAHLRLLEVARAIAGEPQFVLLDEPAAGLAQPDHERLAETLRSLCADGLGVMLIEHNIQFVIAVSERVTVLHRGAVLHQGTVDSFRSAPDVREAYVGHVGDEAEAER